MQPHTRTGAPPAHTTRAAALMLVPFTAACSHLGCSHDAREAFRHGPARLLPGQKADSALPFQVWRNAITTGKNEGVAHCWDWELGCGTTVLPQHASVILSGPFCSQSRMFFRVLVGKEKLGSGWMGCIAWRA